MQHTPKEHQGHVEHTAHTATTQQKHGREEEQGGKTTCWKAAWYSNNMVGQEHGREQT